MPGKSRRKGKYSVQNKKQGAPARPAGVQQPAAAKVLGTAPVSSLPTSSISMPASPRVVPDSPRVRPARGTAQMAKPTGIRYEFVSKELRTIGILAGLMLILLVVVARVLA